MNKELYIFLIVLVASLGFSMDGVIMRLSGVEDGLLLAALRGFGAFLFVVIYNRRIPVYRKGILFPGAVLGSAIGTICFPIALTQIPLGAVMILFHAAIVWIFVLKKIFGRPISSLDRITGFLIFLGVIILMYEPHEIKLWGTVVGLISGIGFAVFLFLGEEESKKASEDQNVLLDAFLFAQAGVAVMVMLSSRALSIEVDLFSIGQQVVLIEGIMFGIAYTILAKAVREGSSHLVAAYIGGLEPFFAILFARIFLGEEILWQMKWGGSLVAGAIIGRSLFLYKREHQQDLRT
jgi:drug/metabolite transporter (DMT)-like permease